MIIPVVLSGGAGTRLWPASRRRRPKQLLPLVGTSSMIHDTLARLDGVRDVGTPIVVTAADLELPVRRSLHDAGIPSAQIVLEPVGRNTAPAVAVAAGLIAEQHQDALMLVLPADHVITDPAAFRDAVETAASAARAGHLVTFGITPTAPETGYGYIRAGEPIAADTYAIAEFKEKPDLQTAEGYLEAGNYLWNSGMFVFGAATFLSELELHRSDIAVAAATAFARADRTGSTITLPADEFAACPSESIDFAVMEHTTMGAMVPTDPGWSDVGSWSSLWDLGDKDAEGNVITGDVISHDTVNSYVRGGDRVIGLVGLDDIVVVDTPDALLVAGRNSVQGVKDVVSVLQSRNDPSLERDDVDEHVWGRKRTLSAGPSHLVAILTIDDGASCDLGDRHHQVQVVDGSGTVASKDDRKAATPGASIVLDGPATVTAADEGLRILYVGVDTVLDTHQLQAFVDGREP